MAPRGTRGMFSYADVIVVCGQPQFHDEQEDVLVNPGVIIEVLSPATESFDRGEKFHRYATHLPSLTEYLLVSQDQILIEHYHRLDDGWLYHTVDEPNGAVALPGIDCSLPLAEIYERLAFEDRNTRP